MENEQSKIPATRTLKFSMGCEIYLSRGKGKEYIWHHYMYHKSQNIISHINLKINIKLNYII
jgi:hypothetical protein